MTSPPIFLVGEAFGENEAKLGRPFVGASGVELLRMLAEAEIIFLTGEDYSYIGRYYDTGKPEMLDAVWNMHPEVYRTNVINRRPAGNKIEDFCGPKATGIPGFPMLVKPSKYLREEFAGELERLADEIIAHDPNLIICLGNTPLWALAGTTGISKVRGTVRLSTHTVSDFKLLPTYHPAAVLRQWELRPTTIVDLMKARRESAFPEIRRPRRSIWIEPTIEDLEEFYDRYIVGCSILSVDIETSGDQITEIGFAPAPDIALVLPFKDPRKKDGNYWRTPELERTAWGFVRRVCEDGSIRKVYQNGLYDIAFKLRSVGIKTRGASEDTMLLAHALQPEQLKGLGFLGSVYTDEGAWKNDRKHTTTIKRDE